jgi:hypothetical protein
MANLNGFNANNVEPADNFDPVPPGKYTAVIVDSQIKPTKSGDGNLLELKFEIIEGEYKGRFVWSRLCLENKNELTVKIAKSQLADICRAVGVMTPADSAQLHNLPMQITVKVRKRSDTDEATNEIRKYSKRETAPVQNTPTAAKGIAPWKR